jgi:[acyl-carrier-protein] S-malonyltransferase
MSGVAFCFPGQGSQRVGMGRDLVEVSPAAARVFAEASQATGLDLQALSFDGPQDELNRTELTQPALVTASVATLRALQERYTVEPRVVIGHSVGEYSALIAAGALDVPTGTRLVRERGLATAAISEGGMAAVLKLDDAQVEQLCAARDDVWPANYNCPGQVVISGRDEGIDAVEEGVREARGKLIRLQVSGAFHSPLVQPAATRLQPAVDATEFHELRTGFMSTVSNRLETSDRVPALLIEQLTAPVRFSQAVQALIADGIDTFVEIGPGGVLAGLIKRIDRSVTSASVGTAAELDGLEEILG